MKTILFLFAIVVLFAYSCKSPKTSTIETGNYETCCDSALFNLEPFTIQTKYGTINMLLPAGYKEVNPDLVIYLNDIKYMEQRAFLSPKSKFTQLLIHIDKNDALGTPMHKMAELLSGMVYPGDVSFSETKHNGVDTVFYATHLSAPAIDSIYSSFNCVFFRDSLYYNIEISGTEEHIKFSFAQKKKIIESVRITK